MEIVWERSQRLCSVLMASLFALSASFQFNDPDWYFWIPLYTSACVVNGMNKSNPQRRKVAKFTFWFGLLLFVKVVMEDLGNGIPGFCSIDMRERVVREKLGSWLVVSSMFLFLESSSQPEHTTPVAKYGMPILVAFAYGLSFGFFMFQHDEMQY